MSPPEIKRVSVIGPWQDGIADRTPSHRAQLCSDWITDAEGRLNLVYCQNALDHVYDPIRGICQMLDVVRPHHAVVLMDRVKEGEREHCFGLHRWNFCREDNDFVISNP